MALRGRRILAATAGLLVLVVLLAVIAGATLVTTESGSRWLLHTGTRLAATSGVEVELGRVRGTLIDTLHLERVRVTTPDLELTFEAARLSWHPAALLNRRLHVKTLAARGIRYEITAETSTAAPEGPPALPDIRLPVTVQVDELRVEDLLLPGGPEAERIDLVTLAARLDAEGLAIHDLEVRGAGARVTGRLGLGTRAPHPLTGALEATAPVPEMPPAQLSTSLSGEALRPSVHLRTTSPLVTEVKAHLDLTGATPRFDVVVTADHLQWPPQAEPEVTAEAVRLAATGTSDTYSLEATAAVAGRDLPATRLVSLTATGNTEGFPSLEARVETLGGTIHITGSAGWAPEPRWDLALALAGLDPGILAPAWPGNLSGRIASRGAITATGPDATVTVERIAGPLRELPVEAAGRIAYAEQEVSGEVVLHGLEGRIELTGRLRPADEMAWDASATIATVNPHALLPDWPGSLSGHLESSGRLPAAGPQARVAVRRLGGTLREQPVAANGELSYQGGTLSTPGFILSAGDNRLRVEGRAGERLQLGYHIDAPVLATAYPGLRGSLRGRGRVEGTPGAPVLQGNLVGEGIEYGDLGIDSIDLEAAWTPESADVALDAAGLRAAGLLIETLSAEVDGPPGAHRLSLAAAGPVGRLELAGEGGLEGARWTGQLTALDLQAPAAGAWSLADPVALAIGPEAASAGRLCLTREDARLCASGRWQQGGELAAEGGVADLPLAWLTPLLPPETGLNGSLDGTFELDGTPDAPRVAASLRPRDGVLTVPSGEETPLSFPINDAILDVRYGPGGGEAEVSLRLAEEGRVTARISMGAQEPYPLEGNVNADFSNLAPVTGFVPALEKADGRLALDMAVGGTLAEPRLDGVLELADGSARVPDAGLELSAIGLKVSGDGSGPFAVSGSLRSGEGTLIIDGTVDPTAADGVGVDLAFRGERLQAVNLPQVRALVSPDLRLAGAGRYHLSGRLLVPQARIEVKELPASAVRVSNDAVVVGDDPEPTVVEKAPALTADVDIVLGKDIRFEGFGLETNLTGSLDATVNDKGSRLFGRIDLVGGSYTAYGQDLKVEQGRLLFNGPVESPTLDLRAVRVSKDGRVKAYLAINSPIRSPRPRVYSEPPLPDAEALAYLVTGRGLDQAGRQDGLDIASVALSLGLDQGEPLLQDLSQRLGLDEIRVETGDTGIADSSIILGKYLSPDLYLSYSQGLLDTVGEVILKLRLTDQLRVETRTGAEQSVDLYYQLERN